MNKKIKFFLVGCIALLTICFGFALWSASVSHTNVLNADRMDAQINEVFTQNSQPSGVVTKAVAFENNSTNASFLRVSYAETWDTKNGNGDILLNNQVDGKDVATKHWINGFAQESNLWHIGNDGWLYYKRVLKPGAKTEAILDYVSFPNYTGAFQEYQNANYQLYFRMELLQVSDSESTLNSPEVNSKASLAVFGKEASVNDEIVTWK